jgi:hypothetical protein
LCYNISTNYQDLDIWKLIKDVFRQKLQDLIFPTGTGEEYMTAFDTIHSRKTKKKK